MAFTERKSRALTLAGATAILLSLVTLGHAWLSGLFSSGSTIDCAPRDRACILEETIGIQIANFEAREYKPNIDPHARTAGDLFKLIAEDMHAPLRERWREAGADEEFFRQLDDYARVEPSLDNITVDELRAVLDAHESPDGRDFGDYTRTAFSALLRTDPTGGIKLWESHRSLLWSDAFSAFTDTLDWTAANDIDALERFTGRYLLPKTALYDGWDNISRIAARHCEGGDTQHGERLISILEEEKAGWKPDQELQAIQWSKMTSGVLYCRGEAAAMTMLDLLFEQMEADIEMVRQKYPNEKEQQFAIGVIRSEVAENAVQVIALWLHDQGRADEARKIFARQPSQAMTATPEALVNEGILGNQFEDTSFDEFIELQDSGAFYADDPRVALDWYVNDFQPTFEICCVERDYVVSSVELIAKVWPDAIGRQAAAKTMAELKRLEGIKPDFNGPENRQKVILQLAALARKSDDCDLTDERLEQILAAVPSYRYGSSKDDVLRAYLRFLDAEPGNGNGACMAELNEQ